MTPARRASNEPARAAMIRRFGDMKNFGIAATDGDLGSFEDFHFDDVSWTVRHLVVDTGSWLPGRHVLLSPRSITGIAGGARHLVTNLTRRQVQDSPGVDTSRPVSRQHEIELSAYYGYPFYWAGPYRWGAAPYPTSVGSEMATRPGDRGGEEGTARGDRHLHSASEVMGYGIAATDGELGHVEDYLIDEESWAIRYLIVDPRSWWPNAHVVVGVDWFTEVSWDTRTVGVSLTRDAVRNAPEWQPERPVDRAWETRLYRHHGREGYWERPADRWLLWPHAA